MTSTIRYLSVPIDIEEELSNTSSASDCFAGQKFSRLLQEYLVDYAMTTSATDFVLSDSPRVRDPINIGNSSGTR